MEKKKKVKSREYSYGTEGLDSSSQKVLRKISPIGPRVVVQLKKNPDISEGGLYLPEGSKDNMSESVLAEVLEVAIAIDDDTDEEANVSGIPLGATVLIDKLAGIKVPWNNDLRIIETHDVLAIVDEISVI